MSNVNFSTSAPAAPSGTVNVAFQTDGANVSANAPLATSSTPGLIQLAGDLGGSSTAPLVAKINGVPYTATSWANWTPTITIANGGSVALGSIIIAEWAQQGSLCWIHLTFTVTLSGTLSFTSSVRATPPIPIVSSGSGMVISATAAPTGLATQIIPGVVDAYIEFSVGSLATGAVTTLAAGGSYRCV